MLCSSFTKVSHSSCKSLLQHECDALEKELYNILTEDDKCILEMCKKAARKNSLRHKKEAHPDLLSTKKARKRLICIHTVWIDGLWTYQGKSWLKLGLNFVTTPKKLPGFWQQWRKELGAEEANDLQGRICESNRTDIAIVPTDKGNSTVVLKKEVYHSFISYTRIWYV